jgi:hypothetical protein
MKLSTVFLGSLSAVSLLRKIKRLQTPATSKEVVGIAMDCPAIRPQQITFEFQELANLVKEQNCKYILEIGTYKGGTLFVFSQIAAADATVISIDFSTTFVGIFYRAMQKPLFSKFIRKGQSLFGSWRESGKVCVLRGFLKSDEFGSRGGHPLRFEQQVVEVAVTASAALQRFDVAVDRLHHSQFDLGPAVVQDSLQVIDQHVRQFLHGL